jgi:hypothetical protein
VKGPGFYAVFDGILNYGTHIAGPDFELVASLHETYTYPISGWSWFENEADARTFFGLPPVPLNWSPETPFAEGDKVLTEENKLLLVVTAGTTGQNSPMGMQMQLIQDGDVQFAYLGDYRG